MKFVDLDRHFVPVSKGQEVGLELGRIWGPKYGGWLDWDGLLEFPRVVLLAEAGSGKTSEMEYQCERLNSMGRSAIFVTVEDLADGGLEISMDPLARVQFQKWLGSVRRQVGWFFLDSVDEARLQGNKFHRALARFSAELGEDLNRARLLISCRVSDWKGRSDTDAVNRHVPFRPLTQPESDSTSNPEDVLLAPIFETRRNETERKASSSSARAVDELQLVQLAPLDDAQRRELAHLSGIDQVDRFLTQIYQRGLDFLAERPSDLLDLATFWKQYGYFDTLEKMTEYGIEHKLRELDSHRADNVLLSPDELRRGAERVAAAFTFGRSSTLIVPSQEPDPELTAGALDSESVLPDWSPAQRNVLLRRGIFAPATYGRLRFHHRTTQEYLTAAWLHRLVQTGCSLETLSNLLFDSVYGVDVVVPALKAPAAWLACRQPRIRDEMIQLDPLLLIQAGDPGALPLDIKKQILLSYARKHSAGKAPDDSLDHRSLGLFAEPGLAGAIRESWHINDRTGFRNDLLRLIAEGETVEVADLARMIAVDSAMPDYTRILAFRALEACPDCEKLKLVADWLSATDEELSPRLAPEIARSLFPTYISVEQLLNLIADTPPPARYSTVGFKYVIDELWAACPSAATRRAFIGGLADILLEPPFMYDHQRISKRHFETATHLDSIACDAVEEFGDCAPVPEALVKFLIVVASAEPNNLDSEVSSRLESLISARPGLKRALFWWLVHDERSNTSRRHREVTRHRQLRPLRRALWNHADADLKWLKEDLSSEADTQDQRLVLSLLLSVLQSTGPTDDEMEEIRRLVGSSDVLRDDLDDFLAPPKQDPEEVAFRAEQAEWHRHDEAKRKEAKQSWIQLRDKACANPDLLTDPDALSLSNSGFVLLLGLTRWLHFRSGEQRLSEAPKHWRMLEEAFGRPVAEGFHAGMKIFWRVTSPERPRHSKDGRIASTILSYAGLGLEAGEDPEWVAKLSQAEAGLAARHAVTAEQGYPRWLHDLLARYPDTVRPIVRSALVTEWAGRLGPHPTLLSHLEHTQDPIPDAIQDILYERMVSSRRVELETIARSVSLISRSNLTPEREKRIYRQSLKRFQSNWASNSIDIAVLHMAAMLLTMPDDGVSELEAALAGTAKARRKVQVQKALGRLFNRSQPLAVGALGKMTVGSVRALLHLAYRYIPPEEDRSREGGFSPDARDHAEEARGMILDALLRMPGRAAYLAVREMAEWFSADSRRLRFRELAHTKAQNDVEFPAWSASEVLDFERSYALPAKTADALLHITEETFKDIQYSLEHSDASPRTLIERAADEHEVQRWLAEKLRLASRDRFHVHRETEVARGDKPDIVLSSTSASAEVAIEIKYCGRDWPVRELEHALMHQLADKYLKPAYRRRGILVISLHRTRRWREPETGRLIGFSALISRLDSLARSIHENVHGRQIQLRAIGIDTTDRSVDVGRSSGQALSS